ncbi:MAG: hypothetical protein WC082_06445 [Victivallales bacterium]
MKKIRWRYGTGLRITLNLFAWIIIGIICLYGMNYALSLIAPGTEEYTRQPILILERVGNDIGRKAVQVPTQAKKLLDAVMLDNQADREKRYIERHCALLKDLEVLKGTKQ